MNEKIQSESGKRNLAVFSGLPETKKACPQCRIDGKQSELKVMGEEPYSHGCLALECPSCGHHTVFVG